MLLVELVGLPQLVDSLGEIHHAPSSPIGDVEEAAEHLVRGHERVDRHALVRMVRERRVPWAEVDGVEAAAGEVRDVRPRLLRADLEPAGALERTNGR